MSGHSKWSTIKRKKEKTDSQRGKIFTKIIREIIVAARAGGADLASNPRLRTAVDTARAVNMPADNIKRGILKGIGELEGVNYEQVIYEGYGPGGVAVMVETLTDNKNRTVAEIRHTFTKHAGSLGEVGCVGWMFDRKGHITVEKNAIGEDEMMEKALDLGASDFQTSDDAFDIYTEFTDFETVRSGLEKAGVKIAAAEMAMIPQTTIKLDGKPAEQMIKLMEELEDLDDVQKVFANFDIDESVLEKLSGHKMGLTVLGIDPGLQRTGYAVIEYHGKSVKLKEAGVLTSNSKDPIEIRLNTISESLEEILNEFHPDSMVVEKLYSHFNHPQTAVVMGHARGIILKCAAGHCIPVISYASTRIKKSVTGNGRASKSQVQRSVTSILKLDEVPEPPDVADAIAVALCHIEAAR